MHFHSQNLNEKNGITGAKWRHGRAWLGNLGWEWVLLKWRPLRLELELATDDHAISASIAFFFFAFWIHLDNWNLHRKLSDLIKRKDERYGNGREVGFYFYEDAIVLNLWNDPMEHRYKDPRWWHIYIIVPDKIFGSRKHSERTLEEQRVEIPMPEGNYPGTVRLFESTWKRPRWPWPKKLIRADVTPDRPVPFPGKGENSWDCGEDAAHSMTCCQSTVVGAVAAFVKSVLEDRYRHGGPHWRPETKKLAS
jgi:hypothetical protein